MKFDQVQVLELCDGFDLVLMKDGKQIDYYHFDQEDSKEALVEVFRELGFVSNYQEVC